MKRCNPLVLAVLGFCAGFPAFGQSVMVMLKPALVYGGNQVWSVSFRSTCAGETRLPREAALQEAPGLVELPNDLAQARLLRAAGRKGFPARLWGLLQPAGATALSSYGVLAGSKNAGYAGVVLGVAGLAVSMFGTPPDPSPYFRELLPDTVVLPAGGGATYGVVSATVNKKAVAIGPFPVGCGR